MNTCDTCKWWDSEDAQEVDGTRECQLDKLGHYAVGNDVLVSRDAEGYSSYVTTGPKFGCVHHKQK